MDELKLIAVPVFGSGVEKRENLEGTGSEKAAPAGGSLDWDAAAKDPCCRMYEEDFVSGVEVAGSRSKLELMGQDEEQGVH